MDAAHEPHLIGEGLEPPPSDHMANIVTGMAVKKISVSISKLAVYASFFVSGFLLTAVPALALTNLNGNIQGTLDASGNPYIVNGAAVPAGATLTVGEGVIIKMTNTATFSVLGNLVLNGTESSPVVFTSYSDDTYGGDTDGASPAVRWKRLRFFPGSTATFTHALILNGGQRSFTYEPPPACVHNDGGTVTFNSVRVSGCLGNGGDAVYMGSGSFTSTSSEFSQATTGVNVVAGIVSISGASIHDNSAYGVAVASGSLTLNNTTFASNVSGAANVGASVNFIHSGNLSPNPINGYFAINGALSSDQTWNADLPYVPAVLVPAGIRLTVGAGAVVKFPANTTLTVDGALDVVGTRANPVTFTSITDDSVAGDSNGAGPSARWKRVVFQAGSTGSVAHAAFLNGGQRSFTYEPLPACIHVDGGTVSFDGVKVDECRSNGGDTVYVASGSFDAVDSEFLHGVNGIRVESGTVSVTSSSFHDNTSTGVSLSGGSATVVGNWWGSASGPFNALTNSTGTGNAVSNGVSYLPFLTYDPTDHVAPTVTISSGPASTTRETSANFTFATNDAGATLSCALDTANANGAYLPCSSPLAYTDLENGSYVLHVVARDVAGNESEATWVWVVRKNNPVVIVPGMVGSHLSVGSDLLWLDVARMAQDVGDDFLIGLQLDSMGVPYGVASATDVVRSVSDPFISHEWANTFRSLIEDLEAGGYEENTSIFVFPYDWRLDLNVTKDVLAQKIDQVKQLTGAEKVDVIAYSMGGLLTKNYVHAYGKDSVDKLVFVGTPHLGAPKAAQVLLLGDRFDIPWLEEDRIKEIAAHSPSAYELLPSPAYFSESPGYIRPFPFLFGSYLDHAESNEYLLSKGLSPDIFNSTQSFFAKNLHDLDLSGVDAYNIAGCKQYTPMEYQVGIFGNLEYVVKDTGDETVPLLSADGINLSADKKFYAKRVKHSSLPSAAGVKEAIMAILSGDAVQTTSSFVADDSSCGTFGKIMSWLSPVEVHVYDALGRHTGPAEHNVVEYDIPGVAYDIIDGHTFVSLPTDEGQTYRVEAIGTDDGTFDLVVSDDVNGSIVRSAVFNDVPVTTATEVSFDLTATSMDDAISVSEGGSAPATVAATIVNNGTVESDFVPPVTTIGVTGTSGQNGWLTSDATVTLSATDDASGVYQTYYALDGGAYQEYATPVISSGDGSHTVRYYSVDNFGMNEDVREEIVMVDAIAPVTTFTDALGALTNSIEALLAFSATDVAAQDGVTFTCALDTTAPSPCTSPVTLTGLGDGSHTFAVSATDLAGNVETTPVTAIWTVDATAPTLDITSPTDDSYTNQSQVTVLGTTDDSSGSGVALISLDGNPCTLAGTDWQCADAPLVGGENPLTVTATDMAGNTTTATVTVHVDTDAPDTVIDSVPSALTNDPGATFTFSATESQVTFECSLNGAPFSSCTSPLQYGPLPDGDHAFAVRARDPAGNVDAGPAEHHWTIDVTVPAITITPISDDRQQGDAITPEFSVTDQGSGVATIEAALNGTSVLSGESVILSRAGDNTLTITATDLAGNTATASLTFNVLGVTVLTPAHDTFVRHGQPNQPEGNEAHLRLAAAGRNRPLLSFGLGAFLSTLPLGATIERTTLTLQIESNADNWGQSGRIVGLRRLTTAWTESTATWNCATDANTANHKADCSGVTAWEMGKPNQPELHPWIETATNAALVTNDTMGTLSFDATADASAILAGAATDNGWILMKEDEERTGRLTFFSKESGTPPTLRVVYRVE